MDRFQNKYRIPSARAVWHEYNGGAYFVTICTAERVHCFGEITDGEMELSNIGCIAEKCFLQMTAHYPYTSILSFVIMPNHIHAIIFIDGCYENDAYAVNDAQGRDAIHRVSNDSDRNAINDAHGRDAIHRVSNTDDENAMNRDAMNRNAINGDAMNRVSTTIPQNPMKGRTLGTVVRGIKARISHEAHLKGIPFKWQTRFYDLIIRDNTEMNRIAEYIGNNVMNWESDKLNTSKT